MTRRYAVSWTEESPSQTTIAIGIYEHGDPLMQAIANALQQHPAACVQVRLIDSEVS